MLRAFSWFVALLLLGGCYSQLKATKQVGKALAHYPQIVAQIALDSFPCDVIRIDTTITEKDTIIECTVDTLYRKSYVKLPSKTIYITKTVESTARFVIVKLSLDSSNNVIAELKKSKDYLITKVGKKNKTIYWLLAFIFAISIPYVIRILNLLTIKI